MKDPKELAEESVRLTFHLYPDSYWIERKEGYTKESKAALAAIEARDKEWREREAELLAIIEGLQDVANGDVTKIDMKDIRGSVAKIFRRVGR